MSFEFRRRDDHTFWWNRERIVDVNEALTVLCKDNGLYTPTHLRRTWIDHTSLHESPGFFWEIVVPWYREGSSGGDTSGETYYDVDSTIAEMLSDGELIKPFIRKFMGGSIEEPEKLVITPQAQEELFEYNRELRTAAQSFLVIGRHTDFAGEVAQGGSGREDNDTGRFYVDFKTPLDEICRVYPEQEEIVCPYPPRDEEQVAA